VFWPVLTVLNADFGWRMTFVICAALHALICLPLHLFALPHPQAGGGAEQGARSAVPLQLAPRSTRLAFLFVAAATTVSTFVTFGMSTSLIEVLRQSGASPDLALQLGSALGFVAMSARLMDMVLGRRGNPILSAAVGTGMMIVSVILLLLGAPALPALVVFVLVYGFGSGVMAVARSLLPLALFAPAQYGLQAARLSLPQNLANAVAPVAFTAMLDRDGAQFLISVCGGLIVVAFAFVMMLILLVRREAAAGAPEAAIP
jgi:predicted MFS family arabinose efflux permease